MEGVNYGFRVFFLANCSLISSTNANIEGWFYDLQVSLSIRSLGLGDLWRHDNGRAEDYWLGTGMGVYAEGYHKVEEHSWGLAWAPVQLLGLHDALHVLFLCCSKFLVQFSSYDRAVILLYSVCFLLDFICSTIYNMCTQKPPHDYSQQLYDKYRESFEEYITSMVRNKFIWDILYDLIHIPYQQLAVIASFKWNYVESVEKE